MIVTNSLTGGGAERSMNLVCNELVSRGWSVSLVPINSSASDQVIPVCEVFALNRQWRGGIGSTILAFIKFNRVVRAWKPETIVLNCDLPELFGAFFFGSKSFVVLEHASQPWAQRPLIGKVVRQILDFRNVTWIAVSSHLSIWPKRMRPYAVLENPVIPGIGKGAVLIADKIKRLLLIGRLSPEKRPEIALEISKRADIELLVIGDGNLRENLEGQVAKELIKAQFIGRVDNPWLKAAAGDLLIVTSASEGDGLVVIEGLQNEIPMLLIDIPDLRRFNFPDKNYCTDSQDFTNRINSFKENLSDLRIPSTFADEILSRRSLATIGNTWEVFLNSIQY